MNQGKLGRTYKDGEIVIRQAEEGNCMYSIQSGAVEVYQEKDGQEVLLATLGSSDFFGEMSLFDKDIRSSSVRAKGEATILTVEKSTLMRTIREDPDLAFRLLETLSSRIRSIDGMLTELKLSERRNWDARPKDE
jgi:CRP/FNR family cyclic AMP-dependent transcriptional regulator